MIKINADIALIQKRDGSWKAEDWMATENQITAKLCISKIHSCEVARTRISVSHLNDLTEGDFVFKVVDMMKNSGWYGQADRILELVGVKETTKKKKNEYE